LGWMVTRLAWMAGKEEEEEESASRKKRRKAREKREERRRLTGQVGILEEGDEVSFGSLLESHDGAVREKRQGRRDG